MLEKDFPAGVFAFLHFSFAFFQFISSRFADTNARVTLLQVKTLSV
jgi:hypothetical protein